MEKQYKILVVALILTVIIQLLIFAFVVKDISDRQIYTTGRIDEINKSCFFHKK